MSQFFSIFKYKIDIISITQNILLLYMTTFKEIDINEYKKLLDNMQHAYAKTFKNIELLHNFEEIM